MMGIGIFKRLLKGLFHASHIRLAGPIELRQSAVRLQHITVTVYRHVRPINSPDKFAPPENLANKSLDLSDINPLDLSPQLINHGFHHITRSQQFNVQRKCDSGVKQSPTPVGQSILIAAKIGQQAQAKVLQQSFGLLCRHRPN